jgi:hypothetical protein
MSGSQSAGNRRESSAQSTLKATNETGTKKGEKIGKINCFTMVAM